VAHSTWPCIRFVNFFSASLVVFVLVYEQATEVGVSSTTSKRPWWGHPIRLQGSPYQVTRLACISEPEGTRPASSLELGPWLLPVFRVLWLGWCLTMCWLNQTHILVCSS